MKKLVIGLLVFGFATQFMFSQIIKLPEVEVINYKYLNAIDSKEVAEPVKMLEEEVATYNLKDSKFYREDRDKYTVKFFIPEGKIVAAYDKDGKVIRTVEKFKNIKLPKTILRSISKEFPNWDIVEDTYKVLYYDKSDVTLKQYKVKLKNMDKIVIVKFNDDGDFL